MGGDASFHISNKGLGYRPRCTRRGSAEGTSRQVHTVRCPAPAQLKSLAWIDYVRNPSRDELVALYNSSSVYLCPSRGEGWHLPPAEAMACGCALVTTNIGGVADYAMADATALVAPVDDVRSLAEGVVRVLTDGTLRHRLIAAGSAQIRSFSWERSARELEMFLQTLVRGN